MDNLVSIGIVLWTFATTLLFFVLGNRKEAVCGVSYERIFRERSVRYEVHGKRITNIVVWSAVAIEWILVIVVATALNQRWLLMIGLTLQSLMVFIIAFKTYSWTQREEVEEMARKQMRYGLILRRNKEGNTSDEIIIIHSNWEKMLAYKMIREIGNSVEDETVLYHLLEETINRIKRYAEVEVCQLGEREPIAIKLYESIIETIFENKRPEEMKKRWNLLNSFLHLHLKEDGKTVWLMKAIIIYLMNNAQDVPKKYLYDFLWELDKKYGIQEWALAYNFVCASKNGQAWRLDQYFNLREQVAQSLSAEKKKAIDFVSVEYYLCKEIEHINNTLMKIKVVNDVK